MDDEPLRSLAKALGDASSWIRLGAAQASPWLAPTGARQLLTERAEALMEDLPIDEVAVVAVALARAGGNPLPLVSALLRSDPDTVRTALMQRHDEWTRFANERIGVLGRDQRFRLLMPFWASWRAAREAGREPGERTNKDEATRRAEYALTTLRHWHQLMTGDEKASNELLKRHSRKAISLLEDGNAAEGAAELAKIAITSPDWIDRFAAQHALPVLGTTAAAPLMDILAGKGGPMPDADTLRGVGDELNVGAPVDLEPDTLQILLASEALERFKDPETTFALINAAMNWRPSARAAAARIIAHMSANRALPPLLWSALNLPSSAERQAAADLLDRILDSEEALGIRAHHIDSTELASHQLDWLREILDGGLAKRDWMADTSLVLPVVGEAISIVPEVVGALGRQYSTLPTASRAAFFQGSLQRLQSFFRNPLPQQVQARPPKVSFPEFCRVDSAEQLSVELLLPAAKGGLPPIDLEFPKGQNEVELRVMVLAPGFEIALDHQTLRLRRDAPSPPVLFDLVPKAIGDQAIDIKFMSGTSTVGQCCVVTHVTKDQRHGDARAMVLDPLEGEALQIQSTAQAVFRVKNEDGVLHWSLITEREGLRSIGPSPTRIGTAEVSHWVEQQGPLIKEMLEQQLSREDQDAIQAQLSGLGNGLYKQVAPASLVVELDKLQENAIVVVDSDAEWVPWELLASRPTEALWGQRFVLVRAPVATRPPNATIATPTELSKTLDRALIVAGDKVSKQKELARLTFGAMAHRGEPPLIEGERNKLLDAIRGKDVVHINCHGRSKPRYHLSLREGIAGRLYPEQAHQLGLKWGTVVFANACSSAEPQLLLADFGGFGREFYYAGARPFIGTLAPVPEDDAIEFARLFYEQFALAGLPAGHALRRAKEESAKRLKRPTWVFYCLYGNPSVVRRWSEA